MKDVKEIAKLVEKIYHKINGKMKIKLSVNCHIKKPFTPFQWDRQLSYQEYLTRISLLKREIKKIHLNIKFHLMSERQLLLEGILVRGDKESGKILYIATKLGNTLNAWLDALKWNKRTLRWYLRPRDFDEVLPWDVIDSGVSKEYLIREYYKAEKGIVTPPCKVVNCRRCGVCK